MSDAAVPPPAIEIRGLSKVYGRGAQQVRAVDGLDLTVRRGEVFGLLGPNGAGKTTTAEICEGLQRPTSGSVAVLGMSFADDEYALRQRIGVCLQETRLLDKQSVSEILALFRSFYDRPRPVEAAIAAVALEEKRDARYEQLSGGQRQRLAVACALVGDPELLFLDEPTTGLDPQSRRRLWDVVRGFRADGGTVLLTTHYMEEAAVLCDRVMVIDHGRCIALGTPEELVSSIGAAHIVELSAERLAERLPAGAVRRLPSVQDVQVEGDRMMLSVAEPHVVLPALMGALKERSIEMDDLRTRHTSLEDVFVHYTGRHLRDGVDAR